VTRLGSPDLGARKFLATSEKEFKDGHRGNLSMRGCINAKHSENKEKRCLLDLSFIGFPIKCGGQSWKTSGD
jgi:hypothetical protein